MEGKSEASIQDLWDTIKWYNIHVIGAIEEGENRAKEIYEELMGNYIWKLMKEDPGTMTSQQQREHQCTGPLKNRSPCRNG